MGSQICSRDSCVLLHTNKLGIPQQIRNHGIQHFVDKGSKVQKGSLKRPKSEGQISEPTIYQEYLGHYPDGLLLLNILLCPVWMSEL